MSSIDNKTVWVSEGLFVFVEGDEKDGKEWFLAKDWQVDQFIQAMGFGTMKSMGYPNPRVETEIFTYGCYRYRFIIINDWGPCYIKNVDTGKEREIKYIELCNTNRRHPWVYKRSKMSIV